MTTPLAVQLSGETVNLMQWLFGALTLVAAFFEIYRYHWSESNALDHAEAHLAKTNRADKTTEELCNDLIKVTGNGLTAHRVALSLRLSQQGQNINILTMDAADHRWTSTGMAAQWLRYAPLAMALTGLAAALFDALQLTNLLQRHAAHAPLKEWSATTTLSLAVVNQWSVVLQDIGTSLIGAMFALILQMPARWCRNRFLANLSQFTMQTLVPLLNPVSDVRQIELLAAQVHQNTKMMNQIVAQLQPIAADLSLDFEHIHQFSRNFQTASTQYLHSQTSLAQAVETLTELLKGNKQQTDAIADRHLQVLDALQSYANTIDTINTRLYETELNVSDWFKQIIELYKQKQSDFDEQLKKLLELTRTNLSNTQSTINRFGISIGNFEKSLETLYKHLEIFAQKNDTSFQREGNLLGEKLHDIKELLQTMGKQNTQQLQELNAMLTTQNNTTWKDTQQNSQLEQTLSHKQMAEQMQKYEEQNQQMERKIEELKKQSESGLQKIFKSILKKEDK